MVLHRCRSLACLLPAARQGGAGGLERGVDAALQQQAVAAGAVLIIMSSAYWVFEYYQGPKRQF